MVETDQRISAVVDRLVLRGWHRSREEGKPRSWSTGVTSVGAWARKSEPAQFLFIGVNGHYSLCVGGDVDDGTIWGWAAVVHRPGRSSLVIDRWLEWPGLNAALLTAWERWQDYRASTDGEAS